MLQDSLKQVEKAQNDSIKAMHQRQVDHFKLSQEARLDAQRQTDSLRKRLAEQGQWNASAQVDAIERKWIETVAHKDSVIASQDQEIVVWQQKVADRDLAISRLNRDIMAATEENKRWKQKANGQDGLLHDVADLAIKGLAIYGAIELVR